VDHRVIQLIDSHAHLGYDALYENIEAVLARAEEAGVVKIVNICTDRLTAERGLALSQLHPNIYNVGSTTPHDVREDGDNDFAFFTELAQKKHLVAIGETGLDYYYQHSPKQQQQEFLCRYFALAKECSLPVVIHCRDAFEDLFTLADQHYKGCPLLLHCFTGGVIEVKKAIDRGWKISFSGIVTFKKSHSLQEAARYTPLDSLMIETDSPYLAPQSKRKTSNEPSFIIETAEVVAGLKNIAIEEFGAATFANTSSFFNLSH
jgi:TatD DNase family protein